MNRIPLLVLGISLLVCGCEIEKEPAQKLTVLTASSSQDDPESRVSIDEATATTCTWSENDKISVFTSSGSFKTFKLESGAGEKTGKFTANLAEGVTVSDYAVYPAGSHSFSSGNLKVNLPASYSFVEGVSNVPMVSTVDESNVLNFKNCGGVFRFGIRNVTVKGTFIFTSNINRVSGDFDVSYSGGKPTINTDEGTSGRSVSISFDKPASETNLYYFYVPVPVGSYTDFTVQIKNEDGTLVMERNCKSTKNVVKRGNVVKMQTLVQPTFTGGNS